MKSTIIIAEAGVNHNGSLEYAKALVDLADDAGADYVKFQTFVSTENISRNATKADYQIVATKSNETQLEMVKKLELPFRDFDALFAYTNGKNIKFLTTPFGDSALDYLINMNLDYFKIPSGEITNYPYLKKIGSLKGAVILSSGMSNLAEIETALSILENAGTGRENITVLHCTTEYPAPLNEVNLRAMLAIQNAFGVKVGYSDHTAGIEISLAAVALGARIIEKHFTLDRNLPGPDHKASLEPQELKDLVRGIRNIELALGDGVKKPFPTESRNLAIARKSIVAKTPIRQGEIFTEKNITPKRPGNGISPMRWNEILGRVAIKDFQEDDLIEI